MTKAVRLGGWRAGDDVPDLDLSVGDDDAGDQPLDELPLLLPGGMREAGPHAPAERVEVQRQVRDLGLAGHLGFQLPRLGCKGTLPLLEVVPAAPVFVETDQACQVDLGQPLDPPPDVGLPAPERVPPYLDFLREPVPAMAPLEGAPDSRRLAEHAAHVVPD